MATNYEDQFQRRYQETLAKLAEGTAAGQNPEEVFQMMQTASNNTAGDPTFSESIKANPQGALPMSDDNMERYTQVERMQLYLNKPLSEITEEEGRAFFAMDNENNMPPREIQEPGLAAPMAPLMRPVGSGSLTDEEMQRMERDSYEMAPTMPPVVGSGSLSDREMQRMSEPGTGAIGELPSSVEGFLGNLKRKMGE
tara:strand:- start:807 stop:1397 length:591 start_codon:yes stop_codon:yes gene_type:complete